MDIPTTHFTARRVQVDTMRSDSMPLFDAPARPCACCAQLNLLRAILPPKRCDYCREWKCQFCTLKFPLLPVKRVLPRNLKNNSRICYDCFHSEWKHNGLHSTQRSNSETVLGSRSFDHGSFIAGCQGNTSCGVSDRNGTSDAQWTVDDARSSSSLPPTSCGSSTIQLLDTWFSALSASLMLVIALCDGLLLAHRMYASLATYVLALLLHPWIHQSTRKLSKENVAVDDTTELPAKHRAKSPSVVARPLPEDFDAERRRIDQAIQYYMSVKCPWKVVRTSKTCVISEMTANEKPNPLFKAVGFIQDVAISDFLSFMDSKRPKDRLAWDSNMARFEVVETFADSDVTVCHNTQRAFLGGLVSARDFCLLHVRTDSYITYFSVPHPSVPEVAGATRGTIHLACYHCKPAKNARGEVGFELTYMCQVDIGGSLPPKLLYNGMMDNMEKMMHLLQTTTNIKKIARAG
ncbi:TPA: hypothetical protein N0F65_006104 [Lagenidium giganteum]|uniref:START domain-containing protein n=1 Tax=Lagenidium giganteum TaxID=4803 RepID=A0AAV2Z5U8_9STRA|nr:TPA: hypothetical protein N0F65_006104 [Lagenidium giganteum]